MGIYYFNIRDELGLIEDHEGIDLPDCISLVLEIVRSADEYLREASVPHPMWFEVTDIEGRPVFMTPVQNSADTWAYLTNLSAAADSMH